MEKTYRKRPISEIWFSKSYKEELKNEIENVEIQEDPQWASVEGLFKIAFAKYM